MPGFMYAQPGILQQIFRFGPGGLLSEKESQQIGAQPANQFPRRMGVRFLVAPQQCFESSFR
jgi:hypothetical protein